MSLKLTSDPCREQFRIKSGDTAILLSDSVISLTGQHNVIGRAIVIHADVDDLGRGTSELSKTTGNAGARVACGVIGIL
ncbi:copper/zinc superoxide dismutase [Ostertagia ostertagi]